MIQIVKFKEFHRLTHCNLPSIGLRNINHNGEIKFPNMNFVIFDGIFWDFFLESDDGNGSNFSFLSYADTGGHTHFRMITLI